ncbi:MAG: hotdog fold thioesterase [Desulfobacterales bacterium]|nr:hotdog fold thioesterase [Desulfobacterales bacterium]MBF0396479.1 hotdog fold thioesterase [Desulfobacterales bacterium]
MKIWQRDVTIQDLQAKAKGTLLENIGIEFLEIGDDFIKARMPVDSRTIQPYGILHGGASVSLAETLGSVAGSLSIDNSKERCVGLEINANHIHPVNSGFVCGIVKPMHIGKMTQIWEIKIHDEKNKLICISRITMAVLKNEKK